jgi:tetratricopeptide (TPR) repeat protein
MAALRLPLLIVCAAAILSAAIASPARRQPQESAREQAYRSNNVGVGQLEQYSYDEAAASFRAALSRDPQLNIAHINLALALFYAGQEEEATAAARTAVERLANLPQAHYVLGLIARAQGRLDAAVAAFRRVLEIDGSDTGSRVNLGQILVQQRQYGDAIRFFKEALAAEPYNVTAAYGLATALTRSGDTAAGGEAMKRFETLRDSAYGVTYAQRYLEQGRYGEAIASTGAEPDLVNTNPPAVTFADATEAMFGGAARPAGAQPAAAPDGSLSLFDADEDGDLDLLATATPKGAQRLLFNDRGSFSDAAAKAGLDAGALSAAAALVGDYDNDGRADVLLLRPDGLRLLHQREDRRFEDVTARSGFPPGAGAVRSAAFVDIDHDGDLDIFAGRLLRNNGNGSFSNITGALGVAEGIVDTVAIAPTDYDNRRDIDLLILPHDGLPRLFQNMRDGTFRDVAQSVGLPGSARYSALAAGDVNKDGYQDFFFGRADAPGVLLVSEGGARFTTMALSGETSGVTAAALVDYDNDGLLDLFTAAKRDLRLFRNLGAGFSDVTSSSQLAALGAKLEADVRAVAFGDLDRDGDLDTSALLANGTLRAWRNEGGSRNRSLLVQLKGRVSNRQGGGSKVDVRAGSLRQRMETSVATPPVAPADVLFGLGTRTGADVVRVIWPSGTLQAEPAGDARTATIEELDRKPSSCPYLYTWNGSKFEFITDFMGGGEIGYWQGPGVWNTPDPDEYVRVPPGALVEKNGRYELRVANELEEALFVDRLELVAVDHPRGTDVFPNEGLGAPAAAAFITATRGARPPAAATDDHGHDVLDRLTRLDRKYPDDFALLKIRGYANRHELRLDLGVDTQHAVLLATGWTDYAFSGDNVAAHQQGLKLEPPALEAKSPSGGWRPVLANIGIPVGRPQTVVIDLRGKLRQGERQVRIVTNMRIYWDQILVNTSRGDVPRRVTRVDPSSAALRWRGFSAETSPDGREPYSYDYDRVSTIAIWKTMTGRYTREGDVRDLLRATDDMFVIARPGDEIAVSFDAPALPPLAADTTRTFLLYSDGFSKEMDINSATPYTVEPLPFHGMKGYPYGPTQRYPSSPAHREYQDRYNTRTISRAVPPL